jgi:hypothetical protein
LSINASTEAEGKVTVRISGPDRKPLAGFDHADCKPFSGDSTAAEIQWNGGVIQKLEGKAVRLEFFVQSGDLYSFRAREGQG